MPVRHALPCMPFVLHVPVQHAGSYTGRCDAAVVITQVTNAKFKNVTISGSDCASFNCPFPEHHVCFRPGNAPWVEDGHRYD
jgi:hypothetical protein